MFCRKFVQHFALNKSAQNLTYNLGNSQAEIRDMEPTEGAEIPPLRGDRTHEKHGVCVQTSAYEDGAWRHTAASCLGSEGLRVTHACGSHAHAGLSVGAKERGSIYLY